ncbi:MAG: PilZ domain-containing protein [Candidatus Competibacteraceae bacterium]|nr:PilZ domain-containing protein [Candidatus Competibacteraceae bacterium]
MSNLTEPTSSLTFTGCLPLAWRELPAPPDEVELRNIEQANLTVLHTLFALDIHAGDYSDDPSALTNASELKRLDFKVSLLLEMVGQLLARQQAIPPQHPLTLTVNDLSWQAAAAPPVGALLQLDLYCNLSYPRPLILYAQVADTVASEIDYPIKAAFYRPSTALQEALERYIFLQHRRFIANRRGNSPR